MPVVPHEGLQAVLAAAVGIAHVAGDALEVGVAVHKGLEDLLLLLVAGLERDPVFPVPLAVVRLVPPQVIGLDAQQHVHIGQALGAEVPGLLPGPQGGAEVAVKADGEAVGLGRLQAVQGKPGAAGAQGGGDAAEVEPVEALQQGVQVHPAVVVLHEGAVHPVIGDLAGPDAVAGLQVVGAQAVGGGLLRGGEDHGGAVDVVAAQHAHSALAHTVVGDHAEEGAVDAQIGQSQGDVGLAAAIAGLEAGGHADLFVVRRCEPQHDLADGDEFLGGAGLPKQRIEMLHKVHPFQKFSRPHSLNGTDCG